VIIFAHKGNLVTLTIDDYGQVRLINQILTLSYVQEHSQTEIAGLLGLSVTKVNRLLKQAREQGMVEISIRTPFQSLFTLENQMQKVCDVPEAVVVPSLSNYPEAVSQAIGRAAAYYLLQHLRDGDVICISGGKTLTALVQAIQAVEVPRQYNVHVVPATGGVQGSHSTDVNYLAAQLADRLGGKAYQLHAPVLVDTPEEREVVLSLRQVREILDMARQAQIALVGIGSVLPEISSYFEMPYLNEIDRKKIVEENCGSGEILAHVINDSGQLCASQYSQRVVGISPAELRAIPLSIGVAGSQAKGLPIYSALRGQYLKTLITDESAAQRVLELYTQNSV
jgi:DNA-binding transcriptional regulator LsrR (DeoR family)